MERMERIEKMHKLAEQIAEMTDTERLTSSHSPILYYTLWLTVQDLTGEMQELMDEAAKEKE